MNDKWEVFEKKRGRRLTFKIYKDGLLAIPLKAQNAKATNLIFLLAPNNIIGIKWQIEKTNNSYITRAVGNNQITKVVSFSRVLTHLGIKLNEVAGNEYEWTIENDIIVIDLNKPIE